MGRGWDVAFHDLVLRCPHCDVRNSGHGNADAGDRHAPEDGSVSICLSCKGVAVFERDGGGWRLRKPSPQEAGEMLRDDDFKQFVQEAAGLSSAMMRRRMPYVWR